MTQICWLVRETAKNDAYDEVTSAHLNSGTVKREVHNIVETEISKAHRDGRIAPDNYEKTRTDAVNRVVEAFRGVRWTPSLTLQIDVPELDKIIEVTATVLVPT